MAIGMKPPEGDNSGTNVKEESTEKKVVTDLSSPGDNDVRISKNKNSIIMAVIMVAILLIGISLIKSIGQKQQQKAQIDIEATDVGNRTDTAAPNNSTSTQTTTTDQNTTTDITIGLPEFDPRENGSTTAIVYSASDYVKDLYGADMPAVYNVANRSYIKDFVNYEKKRAIIDEGMELYWLEITYKGKAYRCQVPYLIFKDLDTAGICVVELELLTLDGGETVISYMQVVRDYEELIN